MQYLTLRDIAKQIGVHEQTLFNWRNRDKFPPPDARLGNRDGWLQETIDKWRKTQIGR